MSDELDELRDEVRGALRRARATVSSELAAELLVPLAGFLLYRPDGELIAAGHDVMVDLRSRIGEDDLPANLVAAGARLAFLAGALTDAHDLVEICLGREPADQDAHRRALHARGVLDLYRGHHHRAVRSFSLVADDISASTVDRLDALGGLGLALCYDGQTTPARSVVERHRAAADAIGSGTYIAFADYMQGEIDLAAGQVDAAIPRLQDAADRAWDVGAGFVWGVAATVLAGALIRHRPPGEAVAHIPVLVERLHRTGTWTQLWTTLRLIAELLAAHGADETSVILLSAADLDPAAPRLSGEDLERYDALREQLRERLGVPTFDGLTTVVHGMERIDVLDRALASVRDLDTG